jgi:hypothetical protein
MEMREMSDFQVDEQVIWTSPHTKERVSMSFRGKTGLTFCCLYNFDTGMQVIAPLSEVEHDWRRMCEVEETAHAQTRTELAYIMQERNEYLERAEAAEARAAALEAERDALAAQLDKANNREQMDRTVMTEASAKITELREQLATVTAERDALRNSYRGKDGSEWLSDIIQDRY